ncbi:hypothetical protein DB345_05840 [Spartobacteria bacterium LR76]|nr:hypothetical protein DB345_05840 [Spartobacteria bacterium LR76]
MFAADAKGAGAPIEARLDDFARDGLDWTFSKGNEFPGAKGELALAEGAGEGGGPALKLSADLAGGGKYVGLGKLLPTLDLRDTVAFRMKIKTADIRNLTFRLTDASNQTHQTKDVPIQADGQWHDYEFTIEKLSGGEHWGGANDARWHGPAKEIFISITERALPESRNGEILFSDLRAEVVPVGDLPAVSYLEEGFDSSALPDGWVAKGDVAIVRDEKFGGESAFILRRDREHFDTETSLTSPRIPVRDGRADFTGAFKSDLESPDSSFNATVEIVALDGGGNVLDTMKLASISGKSNWAPVRKSLSFPLGTTAAQLRVILNKAVGSFRGDDIKLSAPEVKFAPRNPVQRVLIKSSEVGNMFFPGQTASFDVTVQSERPLDAQHQKIVAWITDYWGAEQSAPKTYALTSAPRAKDLYQSSAAIDLGDFKPETGKYYELRTLMDSGVGDSVKESSAFVSLPEAVTKKYSWKEVPFSGRNWDNRIPAYITLTDRVGIRLVGIWGGWKSAPPYKPSAPMFELAKKLGMTMLTRTPVALIEHHRDDYEKFTDEVLRAGMAAFFEEFGNNNDFVVTLGNEPQSTGPTVERNVAAYKVMYEQVKKLSPQTFVVGTSVGPAEEYFKQGFQKYSDAVDFHTYEDSKGLRDIFAKYEELFAKYGGKQPIWSTEMGLNAQGLSRRVVASELIKKFAWFFSFGGENGSWFGVCYPDRDGKLRGSSEDAFNLFDGLYGNYSPRLDAIAYYNVVNNICIKKFVQHREYEDGIQSFLFLDKYGDNLQILWKDHGAGDVRLPIKSDSPIKLTRIDGTIVSLQTLGDGLDLRIGEDPILLSYKGTQKSLPEKLSAPEVKLISVPEKIVRGETFSVSVAAPSQKGLTLSLPPGWQSTPLVLKDGVFSSEITAPSDSGARYVPIRLLQAGGDMDLVVPVQGQVSGEVVATVTPDGRPAVELILHNNNAKAEEVAWNLALTLQVSPKAGLYALTEATPPGAYFGDAAEGKVTIDAHGEARIRVPIEGTDPVTSYKIKAMLTDQAGRSLAMDRFVGGFVTVPKAKAPVVLDGKLDEGEWMRSTVQKINQTNQFRDLFASSKWNGPEDLSGELRFLWDDHYLYIGITTQDDVFHNEAADDLIWAGDGIQLLIDPARSSSEKSGKYDYALGKNRNGTIAWCYLTADGKAPSGEVKEIKIVAVPSGKGAGGMTYEIAIPWSRLSPFHPAVGANLGMAVIMNEDDQPKRDGFMTWFGDIQSKEVDPVGDLILTD